MAWKLEYLEENWFHIFNQPWKNTQNQFKKYDVTENNKNFVPQGEFTWISEMKYWSQMTIWVILWSQNIQKKLLSFLFFIRNFLMNQMAYDLHLFPEMIFFFSAIWKHLTFKHSEQDNFFDVFYLFPLIPQAAKKKEENDK